MPVTQTVGQIFTLRIGKTLVLVALYEVVYHFSSNVTSEKICSLASPQSELLFLLRLKDIAYKQMYVNGYFNSE